MSTDALCCLDQDWQLWRRSPRPSQAMARWQAADPMLGSFADIDELLDLFEHRRAFDRRDATLLALVTLARTNRDAQRTVLHLLRPGLVGLARRAAAWWGYSDAASAVVTASIVRIGTYPTRRSSRVAANLLSDIWHSVWRERSRERRIESSLGDRVPFDELRQVTAVADPHPADEVLALIDEGLHRRRIDVRDARLVALHRVLGYTNTVVADIEGLRPCTVRKRRAAAETALAKLAAA